jgi:tRNA modification GTPase
MDWQDTIVAPASAVGGAARGIIRVSGPEIPHLVATCFQSVTSSLPATGGTRLLTGNLLAPAPVGKIPCQLVYWPTSRSYTGQRAAEFHLPGSPPLIAIGVETLCHAGARLAQPGEFTLRAFLAGRLDLTQAEAVLGVVHARDQRELAVALEQLGGGLAGPLDDLRNQLLDLLAHLEAGLDFVEEDIEFIQPALLRQALEQAGDQIEQLLERMDRRTPAGHEFRVVLRGLPNSGKSSLLNALVGGTRAIVSAEAGTTRDYVRGSLDLHGLPVELIDTAGVEEGFAENSAASHLVSQMAQQATCRQFEQAHVELFCLDSSRPPTSWEIAELQQVPDIPRIVVETKGDLATGPWKSSWAAIRTSSRTGDGLEELKRAIEGELRDTSGLTSEMVQGTAVRCEESLRRAGECLGRSREMVLSGEGEELVAGELRLALDELGRVVGAVYTDDVLNRIFSRFCIGK